MKPDPSSGPTTTVANEFLFGMIGYVANTSVSGSWSNGFTAGQAVDKEEGGYQIVSSTGAYTAAKTGVNSDTWGALIATYKIASGSTTAADSSGNNNTGTLTNGPVWMTGGQDNGGLTFDGTNQYVNLGTNPALAGGSAVTVSAWVKPTVTDGEIIARRDFSAVQLSWELLINGGQAQFTDAVGAGSYPDFTVTSGSTINTGVWTHIVGVYSNTHGVLRIYVNGIADGTTNGSGTIRSDSGVKTFIGAYSDASSNPANPFPGTIDDVRIYNRALTATEVSDLYHATGGQ